MPGNHHPYARCLRPVCPILWGGIYTETGKQQDTFTLYRRWIGRLPKKVKQEQSSEAKKVKPVKGEKIDRKDILKNKNIHQKKDATSFFETCTSFRCNLLHLFLRDTTSFFERCYVFLKKMLRLFKQTGGTDVYGFGLTLSQLIFCDY